MVEDTLRRKLVSMGSLMCLRVSKRPLAREIQNLASYFMLFGVSEMGGVLASVEVRSTFLDQIKVRLFVDMKLNKL